MRALVLLSLSLSVACSFDWDAFDPRLGAGGATAGPGPTTGGAAGSVTSSASQGGAGAVGGEGGAPLGPWGMPQVVAALSHAADDDDPTMTADGLELYFNSGRSGNSQFWVSTRDDPSEPWGMPSIVTELNSPESDTNLTVSPDGLTMWFESDRDAAMPDKLYRSTRLTRADPWSVPVLDDELNQQDVSDVGGITADGLLMLASICASSCDLYLLERTNTTAPWGTAQPLDEINTSATEGEGWLRPDGTAVFFESDRPGSMGGWDLMVSQRQSRSEPFDPPQFVPELSSTESEGDAFASPDLRYIVFSRDVGSAREIFEASR